MPTRASELETSSPSPRRMPFLVDPYDYMNDVASIIHAQIPWFRLCMGHHPRLLGCLLLDSWSHFAYRLLGGPVGPPPPNDACPAKRAVAERMILHYHGHPSCQKVCEVGMYYIRRGGGFVCVLLLVLALVLLWHRLGRGAGHHNERIQSAQ